MKFEYNNITAHTKIIRQGLTQDQIWMIPYLDNVDYFTKELIDELNSPSRLIEIPSKEEIRLQAIINEYRTLINILINDRSQVVG